MQFVKQVIAKFPTIKRPYLQNLRFDDRTMKHLPYQEKLLPIELQSSNVRKEILDNTFGDIQMDPTPQETETLKRQFPCLYPMNPDMEDFNARLQTFDQRWPSQKVNATPQEIAKAGFYFLGKLNFLQSLLEKIIKSLRHKALPQ